MKTRTFDELLSNLLDAIPSEIELGLLTQKQIETLRGAGNALDNVLFVHTPAGRMARAILRGETL